MFYMLQATTAMILVMAANTAFSDFPLLLSYVARDGFAPRQLSRRGERLGFSNGIKLLSAAACILVIVFKSETHALIPLYAIGVFISFTISQFGMFKRWLRTKSEGWRHKALIKRTGSLITFVTVIIIGASNLGRAWIVLILIPIIIVGMVVVNSHYKRIAKAF